MTDQNQDAGLRRLPPLEGVQLMYGITLTTEELTLLTQPPGLLSAIEGQHAYVLKRALTPCKCPACQGAICLRSADPNWDVKGSTPDDAYVCPRCGARLTWYLEVTGGQGFTLNAGQTIEVGEGPVGGDPA